MPEVENLDHITLDRVIENIPKFGAEMAFIINGSEAWAVANGCNGIFTCSVRGSKTEAEAIVSEYPEGQVVPVRIYVEQKERHWQRDWDERERRG